LDKNNNQPERYIEEDEIDLRELFLTLWKKKVFIVGFTLIITILGVIYSYTKTPIYEAKALVEIGSYKLNNNNTELIDNASQLSKRLNVLYIDMLKNQKDRISEIDSISVPKKQNNFLEIQSSGISNQEAIKEINKVIEFIKSNHIKTMDDIKQRRELEIKNIDSKISKIKNKDIKLLNDKININERNLKNYKSELKKINSNISEIENNNPSLTALRLMEKRDLTSYIIDLEIQILDMINKKDELEITTINQLEEEKNLLASMLLPHNYKMTEVIGQIITNDYPTKPKKKLIIAVSFVTGFILSIFLVFFLNFIKSMSRTEQKPNL